MVNRTIHLGKTPVGGGGGSGSVTLIGSTISSLDIGSGTMGSTVGSSLFVAVCSFLDGVPGTPSDGESNTWTKLTTYGGGGNPNVAIFYVVSPTTNVTQGFNYGDSSSFGSAIFLAFSGVKLISPLDQQNGFTSTGTTLQPGSITPSENQCLLITGIGGANGSHPMSVSGSFSSHVVSSDGGGSGSFDVGASWAIQAVAASINPTWTLSGSLRAASTIASFKSA